MEQPRPANTVDAGGALDSDFLDGLADALRVPEAKRRSFKEDVQKAATEFRAERAAPKVGAIRKEITSLAKAIAKVLTKPTQKKKESLQGRLDNLSPEAINYLLRHRPPHDRDTPPWGSGEPTTESLKILYALCCVGAFIRNKNGTRKLEIKYGPVKEPGHPQDHAKMMLVIRIVAEKVLNHAERNVIVKTYDRHEYAAEKRDALERWSRRLREITEPPPPNVVRLEGRR